MNTKSTNSELEWKFGFHLLQAWRKGLTINKIQENIPELKNYTEKEIVTVMKPIVSEYLSDMIDIYNKFDNPNYDTVLKSDYGDLFTVEEYMDMVEHKFLIDDDGYGNPVMDGYIDDNISVNPSMNRVPKGATHILWYNK